MKGPDTAIDRPPDTDRIWTLPNVISLMRLAGIPYFAWLLADDRRGAAAVALAVIATTDWIDGGLARRWHQITTLGKVLDPTIDRLLLIVAIVGMVLDDSLPIWFAFVMGSREVLVGVGGIVLGLMGARRISVTYLGKVYAFGTMVGLPLLLLGASSVSDAELWRAIGWAVLVPSVILSWFTAVQYAKKGRAALD